MTAFLTKIFSFLLSVMLVLMNFFGISGKGDIVMNKNGSLACVDSLGRVITSSGASSKKQVGLFYFLWQGVHGTGGPYDNTKIVSEHPDAILSEKLACVRRRRTLRASLLGRAAFRVLHLARYLGHAQTPANAHGCRR